MTKIVAAFPGTGKSHYAKTERGRAFDSDSSYYSWYYPPGEKRRSPEFPNNYLDRLVRNLGKAPIIFVACHDAVLDGLERRGLPVTFVYPERHLREEYLERYRLRGSPPDFIERLDTNWDDFLDRMESRDATERIVLGAGQYIADVIPQLLNRAKNFW